MFFLKLTCDSNSTPIPAQTEPWVCNNELHDDEDSNGAMPAPRWPPRSPHASPRLEAGLFIVAAAARHHLGTTAEGRQQEGGAGRRGRAREACTGTRNLEDG